jgi:hypothetical protein
MAVAHIASQEYVTICLYLAARQKMMNNCLDSVWFQQNLKEKIGNN